MSVSRSPRHTSSVEFERRTAFRRVKSDALSEGDELAERVWTCNSETLLGICLSLIWRHVMLKNLSPHWQVRQSSTHTEMPPFHLLFTGSLITLHFKHTQSTAVTKVTNQGSSWQKFACSCVCVCVCFRFYVLMREIFLAICVFFIHCICIDVHICVLWKYKCVRPQWIFPLPVSWSHSCFRKLFKHLACNMAPYACLCICMTCPFLSTLCLGVPALCAKH